MNTKPTEDDIRIAIAEFHGWSYDEYSGRSRWNFGAEVAFNVHQLPPYDRDADSLRDVVSSLSEENAVEFVRRVHEKIGPRVPKEEGALRPFLFSHWRILTVRPQILAECLYEMILHKAVEAAL